MKRTRLVEARQRKNWTLEDAAARLCVDPHTLWRWEDGRVVPRAHSKAQLCTVYGASAQELGLECEDFQDPQRALVITMETATTMTDNLKVNLRQDLTSRLMRIVWSWNRKDQYQELQGQINQAIDDYNAVIEQDVERHVTRRDALRSLVLFSVETCVLNATKKANDSVENLLTQCAAGIVACWFFKKGKELLLANEALKVYVSALQAVVNTSSLHKKAAASLLAQCFILKGTLARHTENNDASISYLQQAVQYSDLSENILLRILSWRTLAATYFYADRYNQALSCYEKSRSILEITKSAGVPMLVHSYVYAGVATMNAYMGKKDDALTALKKAHKTFFAQHDEETVPAWIDHQESNLLLNDGLTHYYLEMQAQALNSFVQMDAAHGLEETGRVESLIDRAMAEVSRGDQPRDMDYSLAHWTQGIEGARALQSEQYFNDARSTYQMMRIAWPGEQRIKNLRDLLVHW